MEQLALFIGGAALAGILIGLLAGTFMTSRRYRTRLDGVGEEVVRLKQIAEGKLSEEDPDLPRLLTELNGALEKTCRAVDALENQSALMREKSKSTNDVKKCVHDIMSMMEDMGTNMPYVPASRVETLSANLDKPQHDIEKVPPQLR